MFHNFVLSIRIITFVHATRCLMHPVLYPSKKNYGTNFQHLYEKHRTFYWLYRFVYARCYSCLLPFKKNCYYNSYSFKIVQISKLSFGSHQSLFLLVFLDFFFFISLLLAPDHRFLMQI